MGKHGHEQDGRIHRDALVYVIGAGASEIQRNLIVRGLDL